MQASTCRQVPHARELVPDSFTDARTMECKCEGITEVLEIRPYRSDQNQQMAATVPLKTIRNFLLY
jgi:hypothetical protein